MTWVYHISFFSSALGILVALILYLKNKDESFSNNLLALSLFCISVSGLFYGFYFSTEYLEYPHLWRAPVFFTLLIPPASYWYVRSVWRQQFKFKYSDLFYLIPAILYTLNFFPFYFQSAAEKKRFIEQALLDPSLISLEVESWVHLPGAIFLRFIYGALMALASIYQLFVWSKTTYKKEDHQQNRDVFKWLLFFSLVVLSTYVVLCIEYLYQYNQVVSFYHIFSITVSIAIVFICMYLLLKPNILYGVKGWNLHSLNENYPNSPLKHNHDDHLSIPFEVGKAYKEILTNYFTHESSFLRTGFTIRDLSIELNIPSHQLSIFINQAYGKNFNELINHYRVEYIDRLIKANPSYLRYTLDALGKMAGFQSRSSFIAAVKRYSGKTPSEFFSKSIN